MSKIAFPCPDHDHSECIEDAISRAQTICKDNGIKFTALREAVFKVIASNHKAVGAYEIIEILAETGKRIAPISIYRILDILSGVGLIHRLESQNAYFACHSDHDKHKKLVFFVCKTCETVVEVVKTEIDDAINLMAKRADFQTEDVLLEVSGQCKHCQTQLN